MIADLDTLLTALYVELTDRVIPTLGLRRRGPGRPPEVTDAELVCLAVAQVLLRYDDERHWLRAAPRRVGHLFPRLLGQSEYNHRLKTVSPLMEAALRWLADHTPASAELLRLLDGTPVGCGQATTTAKRSGLFGYAGYGYEPSHSRYYWGVKLLLLVTAEGTVTGFALANPKLLGERQAVRQLLIHQPANRPPAGSAVVSDKGLSGGADRGVLRRPGPGPGPPGSHRPTPAWTLPQLAAPARRGGHLDAEAPTRPGTPWWACPRWPVGPDRPTAPGSQRRDLAQLDPRRARQALLDRLRPLTTLTRPDFPVNDLGRRYDAGSSFSPSSDGRREHHGGYRPIRCGRLAPAAAQDQQPQQSV